MATIPESPENFLSEVYKSLEFENGKGFYPLSASSSDLELSQISWFEQAKEIGAKAIFFVENYPAVLFFQLDEHLESDAQTEDKIRELHIKVWNTSHVPIFFLALPGELRVYSAYQKPVKTLEEWSSSQRWLEHVKAITQIAELTDFSRQMVESGGIFQLHPNNFVLTNRVDNFLLSNLRLLRDELEGGEIDKRKHIHALISITAQYW